MHVYVNTPLDVCEARDRKGLYKKARAGLVEHFTGVSDTSEEPTDADVVVNAAVQTPEQASESILEHLVKLDYLSATLPSDR